MILACAKLQRKILFGEVGAPESHFGTKNNFEQLSIILLVSLMQTLNKHTASGVFL